jgi:hypothetical protein
MKTQIATIFAALVLSTGIAKTTHAAAPAKNATYTVLTDVSNINKIEVRGNVQVYISDGATDQVKVYNKYYGESALVQSKNGVLRIASYKAEKLVVWVTAADLRSVSAFDNAEVQSFGDVSKIEFNVDLHDSASAKLNLDAYSANVTIADQAKANLSGTVTKYGFNYSHSENINTANFEAVDASNTQKTTATVVKANTDDLADLID